MTKIAKLVYISLATRVVVDENATDEQILDIAKPRFIDKIKNEIGEHLDDIIDDAEMPYDPDLDFGPTHVECSECDWEGEHDELRTNMIPNIHNRQDKSLYEVKVCPECGTIVQRF